MPGSTGDAAQTRLIVEQAIEATIVKMKAENVPEAKTPATLKWWGAIGGAVAAAVFSAGCVWLISSVSSMQLTVTRIEEQLKNQGSNLQTRFEDLDSRVDRLEDYHRDGGK